MPSTNYANSTLIQLLQPKVEQDVEQGTWSIASSSGTNLGTALLPKKHEKKSKGGVNMVSWLADSIGASITCPDSPAGQGAREPAAGWCQGVIEVPTYELATKRC